MKRIISGASVVAGLLLASGIGCAGMGSEKKSEAVNAQDTAQGQYQHAADAQQNARDEQRRAEAADREVIQKQKELADSQARARGQEQKAAQSQQDAARQAQIAQQTAAQAQSSAQQLQQRDFAKQAQNQQQNQKWAQQQTIDGKLVSSSGSTVQVTGQDSKIWQLGVSDSTAILQDGRMVPASQLSPGSDVRASYQMVDGQAKALRIEATSNSVNSPQQAPQVPSQQLNDLQNQPQPPPPSNR